MQAWHKKEKAKQVKKGKAEKQKLRTEKLARRNPDRIQKQIDELKAVEEGGQMGPSDRKQLADLERDLAAVKKAKEALGEKVPERRVGGAGVKRSAGEMEEKRPPRPPHHHNHHYKQREEDPDESDSGESTSSSVREIPMPPGTPPPLPKEAWPRGPRTAHELPEKPATAPAQTTYAAAPILRDLRKEAAVFVPAAVKKKMLVERAARGEEEEEAAEEEAEAEGGDGEGEEKGGFVRKKINAAPDVDVEFSKFQAEMEEVPDEGV
ncbi:WW domain binding protein 11-domain-containing protein [Tuber borchii]|uniref:WW domain binding protein 11-domain-containing protein n=1 Tax=Tuber borchii TaxID=42251 RepID=A0A2T6ZPX3_TUBBO|nr:WW domain binding protein 11-domain-containing protein [Tuber borchii]